MKELEQERYTMFRDEREQVRVVACTPYNGCLNVMGVAVCADCEEVNSVDKAVKIARGRMKKALERKESTGLITHPDAIEIMKRYCHGQKFTYNSYYQAS